MTARERDEQILASIIGGGTIMSEGAYARGALLLARGTYGLPFREDWLENRQGGPGVPSGPCCAVGAGILFRGIKAYGETALSAFAHAYDVSIVYAIGVSDGFEEAFRDSSQEANTTGHRITRAQRRSSDYVRGWTVGCAVAMAADSID